MALLVILDLNFVYVAYNHTIQKGASVQLVFGFEVNYLNLKKKCLTKLYLVFYYLVCDFVCKCIEHIC